MSSTSECLMQVVQIGCSMLDMGCECKVLLVDGGTYSSWECACQLGYVHHMVQAVVSSGANIVLVCTVHCSFHVLDVTSCPATTWQPGMLACVHTPFSRLHCLLTRTGAGADKAGCKAAEMQSTPPICAAVGLTCTNTVIAREAGTDLSLISAPCNGIRCTRTLSCSCSVRSASWGQLAI